MPLEENLHLILHATQIMITLIIIYYFFDNYRKIRSSFNLGLLIFSIAMLIQITVSFSLNLILHMASELFELTALLIFIRLVRK